MWSIISIVLLAFGLAAVWWVVRYRSFRWRIAAVVACFAVLWSLPWFVCAGSVPVRVATTLFCCAVLPPKLMDAALDADVWRDRSIRQWLAYLLNPFVLCYRLHLSDPPRSKCQSEALLWRGLSEVIVGGAVLYGAFQKDWHGMPFAAEHVVKLSGFYLVVFDGGFITVNAALRLLGGNYLDFCVNPILARTPADFWRRYNRDAGRFLHENVFKRLPWRDRRVRIIMVFLVNGLWHEYLAIVITHRFTGFQLMFFALQGAGVLLTWRCRPRGLAACVAVSATLIFNVMTSVLFFASFDLIQPWRAALR